MNDIRIPDWQSRGRGFVSPVSIHSSIVKYLPVDGYSYWIMEATDFFYTHNFVSNSIAVHYKL